MDLCLFRVVSFQIRLQDKFTIFDEICLFFLLCDIVGKILGICFLLYRTSCTIIMTFVTIWYFLYNVHVLYFLWQIRCDLGCILYKALQFLLLSVRVELVGFRLVYDSWPLLAVYVFFLAQEDVQCYSFVTLSLSFFLFCIGLSSTWFVGLICDVLSFVFYFFFHRGWRVLILRCLLFLFVPNIYIYSFCVAIDWVLLFLFGFQNC